MFGSIGGPELLAIFAIALLIFGPRRLSELGRTLGKGIAEVRKATTDTRDTPAPAFSPACARQILNFFLAPIRPLLGDQKPVFLELAEPLLLYMKVSFLVA